MRKSSKRRGPGRPRGVKYSSRIVALVTPELEARVRSLCGTSLSTFARLALEREVAHRERLRDRL